MKLRIKINSSRFRDVTVVYNDIDKVLDISLLNVNKFRLFAVTFMLERHRYKALTFTLTLFGFQFPSIELYIKDEQFYKYEEYSKEFDRQHDECLAKICDGLKSVDKIPMSNMYNSFFDSEVVKDD